MDDIDKKILNRIQGEFPISESPYKEIAASLGNGLGEAEVLDRVRKLKEEGVVRKVGPFFDPAKMDHSSTLCAMEVPPDRTEEVAEVVSGFQEVTHNYLREGSPNLWFTLIAPSEAAIERIIAEIERRTGVGPIHNLPASRKFKIKVDLRLKG